MYLKISAQRFVLIMTWKLAALLMGETAFLIQEGKVGSVMKEFWNLIQMVFTAIKTTPIGDFGL